MSNIFRELITEKPILNNKKIPASRFEFYTIPFTDLLPVILKYTPSSTDPTFGFTLKDEYLLKRAFVKTIKPKYPASKIFSNPASTNNNARGAFLDSMSYTRVFTSLDALKQILLLHKHRLF